MNIVTSFPPYELYTTQNILSWLLVQKGGRMFISFLSVVEMEKNSQTDTKLSLHAASITK